MPRPSSILLCRGTDNRGEALLSNLHHHHHNPRRRQFLSRGSAAISGAVIGSVLAEAMSGQPKPVPDAPASSASENRRREIFDAHLHCPAENGELWQWHKVTRNFADFVAYLDRTGVGRGIINSQRCQQNGIPVEFVAGNREVARYKNCYLDTSGYGHDRMGMLEYAVKTIGEDRVLFGSDFSINDPSTVIARVEHSFLTEEQKQKILAGNLQSLLNKFQA